MCDEFLDSDYLIKQTITPEQFVCYKAILGDIADNIKSACIGVGDKSVNELYKYINTINNNNLKYPTTEDELNEVCAKFDITKRNAFLNFNPIQYKLNLQLIDLQYVDAEISEELIQVICDIIEKKMNSFANPAPQVELNMIYFSLELDPIKSRNLINRINSLADEIYI